MKRITVAVAVEDILNAARAAGMFNVVKTTGPQHISVSPAEEGVLEFTFTPWTPEEVEQRPVEDLDLSVRAYNVLKRAGIHTVGQVARLRDEELEVLPHYRPSVMERIDDALWAWDLARPRPVHKGKPQVVAAPEDLLTDGLDEH